MTHNSAIYKYQNNTSILNWRHLSNLTSTKNERMQHMNDKLKDNFKLGVCQFKAEMNEFTYFLHISPYLFIFIHI